MPEKLPTSEYFDTPSAWMKLAYCRDKDPNIFFPSDGVGLEIARSICRDCVVKEPCLEYAVANRIDDGVWGGTSERERRRILKHRRQTGQL